MPHYSNYLGYLHESIGVTVWRRNSDVECGLARLPPRPRVHRLLRPVLDGAEVLEEESRVPLRGLED